MNVELLNEANKWAAGSHKASCYFLFLCFIDGISMLENVMCQTITGQFD